MILPSTSQLWSAVFGAVTSNGLTSTAPQCPLKMPLTCHNSTAINDQCCFEYPGGIFVQTQFWNYSPSRSNLNETELIGELGPLDSFTIHGLWPDNCMGAYEQFCKKDMFIDDVYHLLHSKNFSKGPELYSDLDLYWKSNVVGNDESLWIHEFNKHGSCIRNIRPECYARWEDLQESTRGSSEAVRKQRAVFDYFNATVELFKKLNSYKILEDDGIVPSSNKTYSKLEIMNALQKGFDDKEVFINCNSQNELQEVWYFHLLNGSFLDQKFVPTDSLHNPPYSRCKETGIKYFPKGYTPDNDRDPSLPPWKRTRRGTLRAVIDTQDSGFLIRNGHWMKKGTPANFELLPSPFGNFNLKSKGGYCSLSPKTFQLECKKRNEKNAAQFEYDDEKQLLGYSGTYEWGAKRNPTGRGQVPVFHVDDDTSDLMKYKFHLKFNQV
ncbi:ribonuclease T2 KNAG_0J01390 [Huiozyma naganishii CBS 8797]|uniref:Ribonuclease T2-like n=1 Tax=Huiozyma naganishii (strain ATCC MYA-139 / BCRC 22969 / CBS 8797 / KCTC 17520 / NBRC 10181 / NCYC 3082 / Yp74L-3) TaxID=1071383 RepID=J7RBG5_HUIN7|nr:hypothetical protein KNAG_0J01390 [Kazachstania naganishii CBS 8797]CCK72220.1 hypothetical protein KNAG_0J01390 [Kazachstania naganishii CBS 8797]